MAVLHVVVHQVTRVLVVANITHRSGIRCRRLVIHQTFEFRSHERISHFNAP
jgi:hypothetical protein